MIWDRFFPGEWLNGNGPGRWTTARAAPENPGELGEEAKALLDNPTLHEALDKIERKLQQTWKQSPAGDREAREEAYRLHWAVEALRAELRIMIASAGMAARAKRDQ